MKPKPVELEEGTAAFEQFQDAVKAVMQFPKSELPPDPFGSRKRKQQAKEEKPKAPKG